MEQNRQDSRHRRRWLLAAGVALVALVALTLWQARDAVAQTAGRLVYGAPDDKRGFMEYGKRLLHPKTQVEYGVMFGECSMLLKEFFRKRRK